MFEFSSTSCFSIAGRGTVWTFDGVSDGQRYPLELQDPVQLQGIVVKINGIPRLVKGAETFCVYRDERSLIDTRYPRHMAFGLLV